MESEGITKLVDGVYKNILEKFNPGARQLITSGKGYLKALHGAASASRLFNESLAKIAMNAQQSGTNDIGAALFNVVSVYKEIQEQQMNILKAFYVDLLVPLETNLEKDTKVVQHEQKMFLQQHKIRVESYHKAMATMKKQRKKKSSPENTEKELRSLQILEDQKNKLDAFCEQSYKNALTQERRRYGFVLERQCSIARHWVAYHSTGKEAIDNSLNKWDEIATTREVIPLTVYESNYSKRMELMKEETAVFAGATQLKKSRSVDAPYGDMRTLHENTNSINYEYTQNSLPRAKSDFNLTTTLPTCESWDQRPVVKALYAYMPSGENQLSFEENDKIALVGHKAKGWQFGENLRTQIFGWFPIAYTNTLDSDNKFSERDQSCYENIKYQRDRRGHVESEYTSKSLEDCDATEHNLTYRRRNNSKEESSPTRMFGDTINLRSQKKYRGVSVTNPRPGPPPTLPAPIPAVPHSSRMLNASQSFCSSNGVSTLERRGHKSQSGLQASHNRFLSNKKQTTTGHLNSGGSKQQVAKTSLHSSNDSGFANEPPPQPEVDYSDEDNSSRVPIRRRAETNTHSSREVSSWTLNRNFRSSVDGHIDDKSLKSMSKKSGTNDIKYDTMIASDDEILQSSGSSSIKRTKSFWKFGRNDDPILAGMSLWRHRDLVTSPIVNEIREITSKISSDQESEDQDDNGHSKSNTLTRANSNYLNNNATKKRKESVVGIEMYEGNENIYDMKNNTSQQRPLTSPMRTNFTPKSRMKIMKTIEIDIENHNNDDTIRKEEKKFQHEQTEQSGSQQPTNRNSKEHEMQKKQHGLKTRNASKNNGERANINQKKSNMDKTSGNVLQKQAQYESQQKQRSNTMALLHSTEDEDESDNNGTLKMSDVNNFFDDIPQNSSTGVIMKTVKRKDILKQYYTSEEESDDPEIKSTSSDPYDCIVINDHLARRDEKQRRQIHNSYQEQQMEFQTFRATSSPALTKNISTNVHNKSGSSKIQQDQESERYNSNTNTTLTRNSIGNNAINTPTATILPRTRLMKSANVNSLTLERNREQKLQEDKSNDIVTDKEMQISKTYGPWYDFWDPQLQHTLTNSKSGVNLK